MQMHSKFVLFLGLTPTACVCGTPFGEGFSESDSSQSTSMPGTESSTSGTDGGCEEGRALPSAAALVTAGQGFTCALTYSGDVHCWGSNSHGQLGLGHNRQIGDDEWPSSGGPVSLGRSAIRIASANHTCAITDDFKLTCWGANLNRQLGYGHQNHVGIYRLPSDVGPVPSTQHVRQVSASPVQTCALTDERVSCWGRRAQSLAEADVESICAGFAHACAVKDGQVRCWGSNKYGQLGHNEAQYVSPETAEVLQLPQVDSVHCGDFHTCALTDTGDVACWGRGDEGQLGREGTEDLEPDRAFEKVVLTDVAALDLGGKTSCAIHSDGTIKCWGDNEFGQLGVGSTTDSATPQLVELGQFATQVSVGVGHVCALTNEGGVRCWGRNDHGQLGYAHTNNLGDNEKLALDDVVLMPE